MARKTLGYTELQWTCPNCKTKNSGLQKTCTACGAPQPASVRFEQGQTQQLIEDQQKIAAAKAGPDFHCMYCGARNATTNQTCVQCGADLTGAARRQSGRIVGAFQEGEVQKIKCPHCGEMNLENAAFCENCGGSLAADAAPPQDAQAAAPPKNKKKGILIFLLVAAALLFLCILLFSLLTGKKDTLRGTVQRVAWTRTIDIEQFGPVTREDWEDSIPAGAAVGECELKYHHTQNEPAPNAQEICGTPYVVDTGSGAGEVVQDCEYRIYLNYCTYQIDDWQAVNQITLQGSDLAPAWPSPYLDSEQRAAEGAEEYACFFATEDGVIEYNPGTEYQFRQCQIGSTWTLSTNAFGAVIAIEPEN